MTWTKEDLERELKDSFIENKYAFGPGRRNDDTVDSMCICFALDIDWLEECWKKHVEWMKENETPLSDNYYMYWVEEHADRVSWWLKGKENNGYKRGEYKIMNYAINV